MEGSPFGRGGGVSGAASPSGGVAMGGVATRCVAAGGVTPRWSRSQGAAGSRHVCSPSRSLPIGAWSVACVTSSSTAAHASPSSVCSSRSKMPVILRRPAYGSRSTSWTRAPTKRSKSVAEKPSGRAEPAALTVIAGWPGMAAHSASRSAVDASPRAPEVRGPSGDSIQHRKAPACFGPRGGRASTAPTSSRPSAPAAAASDSCAVVGSI